MLCTAAAALKVIVERYKKEKLLPAMDKSKFLLPEDLSVAQFSSVVRWLNHTHASSQRLSLLWEMCPSSNLSVVQFWQLFANLKSDGFSTTTDDIWRVHVDLGSALAHQIWPSSAKGGRYGSPQMSKFAKNCGFWPPEADTMNTFRWN